MEYGEFKRFIETEANKYAKMQEYYVAKLATESVDLVAIKQEAGKLLGIGAFAFHILERYRELFGGEDK